MRGRMRGRGRGHLGGGEREGGRKWAVGLDPLLKSLSLPLLLLFIIIFLVFHSPSFKEFVPEFNHSKWEYEKILLKHPRYPTWHHHSRIRDHT